MKNLHLPLVPIILLPLAAVAQETKDMPPPVVAIELQSLQSIVTDTVYRRQPTATAEGSVSDTAFAIIRDAEVADDGRLTTLVVGTPPDAKVPGGTLRLLPASAVRWEAPSRHWLLVSPTQTYEELALHEQPAADAKPKPATAPLTRTARLASELLRCEPGEAPADRPVKVIDANDKKQAPRIVWWFAPTAQQLAVAVVPAGGKHRVVPWSALRFDGSPQAPKARIEPATNIATAPACEHGDVMPDHTLRLRSYEHFGVAPPAWDRQPADHAPRAKAPGKIEEVSKG